jgi:hypothetical protein
MPYYYIVSHVDLSDYGGVGCDEVHAIVADFEIIEIHEIP